MAGPPETTARIFDQGYRPWQGVLAPPGRVFLAIAANELRQAWKEKRFRQLAIVSFFPLGIFGLLMLLRSVFMMMPGFLDVWRNFWSVQLLFSMAVVYYVGRNSIGEDLRSEALTLYFSRPVSFGQYLLGKWFAVAGAVGAITLAPGLLLSVFEALVDPSVTVGVLLRHLGALLVLTGLWCLCSGSVILAMSSLFKRGRTAGILWVLLYFLLAGMAEGLAHATGMPDLKALSFGAASTDLAGRLLGQGGLEASVPACVAGQLGWTALSAGVVWLRLRSWRRN